MMMMMMMITLAVAVIITTTINTCRQVKCVEASTQPSSNLKISLIPSGEMSYLCQGTDRNVFFETLLIKFSAYFYTVLHIRVHSDVSVGRAEALVIQFATQKMEVVEFFETDCTILCNNPEDRRLGNIAGGEGKVT